VVLAGGWTSGLSFGTGGELPSNGLLDVFAAKLSQ
jgi:hypothetical protein